MLSAPGWPWVVVELQNARGGSQAQQTMPVSPCMVLPARGRWWHPAQKEFVWLLAAFSELWWGAWGSGILAAFQFILTNACLLFSSPLTPLL